MTDVEPPKVTISFPDADPVRPNRVLGSRTEQTIAAAAQGDLSALRALFNGCVKALDTPNISLGEQILTAVETVTIGRFMASHNHPDDSRRLAGALCMASTYFHQATRADWGDHLMAEALTILEQLAERGDDGAAIASQALIEKQPHTVIERMRMMTKEENA